MAAITLADGEELNDADLTEMVTVFKKCLPTYAVPVFLRVQKRSKQQVHLNIRRIN